MSREGKMRQDRLKAAAASLFFKSHAQPEAEGLPLRAPGPLPDRLAGHLIATRGQVEAG